MQDTQPYGVFSQFQLFFPVRGNIIIQRAFRIPCPESSLVLRVENSKLLFLSFGLTNSEICNASMICLVSFQSLKKPSYPNEKYCQSYCFGVIVAKSPGPLFSHLFYDH